MEGRNRRTGGMMQMAAHINFAIEMFPVTVFGLTDATQVISILEQHFGRKVNAEPMLTDEVVTAKFTPDGSFAGFEGADKGISGFVFKKIDP